MRSPLNRSLSQPFVWVPLLWFANLNAEIIDSSEDLIAGVTHANITACSQFP